MNYNKFIDHTILKPEASEAQVVKLCEEAKEFDFASVCVNPCHVALCAKLLANTDVKVCTVIGFPLGANTAEVKGFETKNAVDNGATEIDMVINVGALKDKKYDVVFNDIKAVVDNAMGKLVKVILETCLLTPEEIVKACELSKDAGADFVKTSTGFNKYGATVEDVALMRKTVGPEMGVKASGGVRTLEDLEVMVEAGATRIGASAGIAIMQALKEKGEN